MDDRLIQTTWRDDQGLPPEEAGSSEPAPSSASKFTFDDVCYVLFRHKWKIIFFSLLGFAAAGVMYQLYPRLYHSEAELMVKYVTELELAGSDKDAQAKVPILRGETVVNNELRILTSEDVAEKVAEAVGPSRILAAYGGGNDLVQAALVVRAGMSADAPNRGSVIRVTFEHPDWRVVQPVLSNIVSQYFLKHAEIHKNLSSLDDFAIQKKAIEKELNETGKRLFDLQKSNGVYSLEQAKRTAQDRVNNIATRLSDAEMELRARESAMKALQSSNAAPLVLSQEGLKEREERLQRYRQIVSELEKVKSEKLALSAQYPETSKLIKPLQDQITALDKQRKEMERLDANLLITTLSGAAGDGLDAASQLTMRKATVEALRDQLKEANTDVAKLYELESSFVELQRAKELEENKYKNLSVALDNAQIDSGLGARFSNISPVEAPTPPALDVGPLYKRLGMLAFGGVAFGIALALLMEFFVDQTVKRPIEFSRMMPLPLYMSIPKLSRTARAALPGVPGALLEDGSQAKRQPSGSAESQLQPYIEALRDRILNRFENLARKPKLVGVCGCVPGSGVTSIAAGLAASLSEAGDLKVLLVDMKRSNGRPHPMLGGGKSLSLMDALEGPKRQEAQVAPNLYLATAGAGNQQVVSSPRRFTTVVPQLNASDYDYIVFDMPPVNSVSITPRLAKHMDLTLLVVEAEKARRSTIQGCGSLLTEFTENVAVVLNKTRSYLPRGVEQLG